MEKRNKELLRMARRVVRPGVYRKLRRITDEFELGSALEYSIVRAFELAFLELEDQVKSLESVSKDVFFVRNKLLLIPARIKHFRVEFDRDEFYKLSKLINEVERGIKNHGHV